MVGLAQPVAIMPEGPARRGKGQITPGDIVPVEQPDLQAFGPRDHIDRVDVRWPFQLGM